ncbi:zinc-dependent alcohol dehydrogenase family protein [Thermopolyspora sp. NPDC052614]|uniref:zinc-dependent alcohol dehydrogenase family protein n=1 Tax=Thermopolyspora sp. NPDC052614 TaxID=3155682 RepID=UPI003423C420
MTVKAVVIQAFGSPEGVQVVDLPEPALAEGQALIRSEAIGVGGVDAVIRRGTLGEFGFREGLVLGSEVAGTVTAVGDGVDASWIGRRVWAFTGLGGGYAEQAVASVADLVPLPEGLSAADAVTVGGSGVVAHFALAHVHFAPGESVLVRGAAGGIGVMAVQLAARGGAEAVAVTTASDEHGERLRKLGATHVLDRSGAGEGLAGYDVIVDIVGGADLPAFLGRLNPNGRLALVGAVAGWPPADFGAAMMAAFQRSLTFATFSADTVAKSDQHAVRAAQFAALNRGEVHSVVHEVLPLDEAAVAHRMMDDGEVFGRIVLTP